MPFSLKPEGGRVESLTAISILMLSISHVRFATGRWAWIRITRSNRFYVVICVPEQETLHYLYALFVYHQMKSASASSHVAPMKHRENRLTVQVYVGLPSLSNADLIFMEIV